MPTPTGSTPSSDFTQALDATNAEVMALQPAVLANLALANEVFNTNLQQQMLIAQQQAMNQLILATVGKCVSIISQAETRDIKVVHDLLALLKSLQPIPSAVGTVPAPVGPAAA
jgi:inosine-uridine nucleoside N-ribohydrolase